MKDIELIPLKEEDIELVREWRNSPEVSQYMFGDDFITKEQQERWFDSINRETKSKYWIIKYEEKKLGVASIVRIDKNLQSCHWGFYLGDSSIRGAGIGTKVEYNVIKYVFDCLNLNKLQCEVFTTNEKVIKMQEKFGFRREAYYREHCIKKNKKIDVVGLALLQSEWRVMESYMKNKIYES